MITSYHRPDSLAEALGLLSRTTARTLPLGGGTWLARSSLPDVEVVDLQGLGLNTARHAGDSLELGACVTLQQLLEHPSCPAALRAALRLEAPLNLRNAATIAGTLMLADGRSPFAMILMALDAQLTIASPPGAGSARRKTSGRKTRAQSEPEIERQELPLAELAASRGHMNGRLITQVSLPLAARIAFEYVSRTPADTPMVSVAMARWASGRTRVAVGGYGAFPALAMDGTEPAGAEVAAQEAAAESGDEWASAEYRMHAAAVLARRCMRALDAST